ncbi:MAG: hypothetical protein KUG77_22850 [Nannocystaceae bacterium]|nr:hypothetical protein [Nannocystaceae bacterium]
MMKTTCGNLTPVRTTRCRPLQHFSPRTVFSALLMAAMPVSGCGSEPAKPASTEILVVDAAVDPDLAGPKPMTEDQFAQLTEQWRDRISADPSLPNTAAFFRAKDDLSRVSHEAKDIHLRANASLLLGLLYEGRADVKGAIAQYQHVAKLVPDDAGPYMALALALGADKQFKDAAQAQKTATTLDPDNLENWLVLGELLMKSGDKEAGAAAYVDYERRRKGLIDGLTLKNKQGGFLVGPDERVGCAEALASATDQGTAVALTYAFKSDPQPSVRSAAAAVMGVQRLTLYRPALEAALPTASGEVKESVVWALAEIERDPVTTKVELPPEVAGSPDQKPSDEPKPETPKP